MWRWVCTQVTVRQLNYMELKRDAFVLPPPSYFIRAVGGLKRIASIETLVKYGSSWGNLDITSVCACKPLYSAKHSVNHMTCMWPRDLPSVSLEKYILQKKTRVTSCVHWSVFQRWNNSCKNPPSALSKYRSPDITWSDWYENENVYYINSYMNISSHFNHRHGEIKIWANTAELSKLSSSARFLVLPTISAPPLPTVQHFVIQHVRLCLTMIS